MLQELRRRTSASLFLARNILSLTHRSHLPKNRFLTAHLLPLRGLKLHCSWPAGGMNLSHPEASYPPTWPRAGRAEKWAGAEDRYPRLLPSLVEAIFQKPGFLKVNPSASLEKMRVSGVRGYLERGSSTEKPVPNAFLEIEPAPGSLSR